MGTKMMTVQSTNEMQTLVNTYLAQGYEVQMISPQMSQLSKGGGMGSIFVHIVWLLVVPIIGNFLYLIYRSRKKNLVNIVVE
jgi:hypothetical protein